MRAWGRDGRLVHQPSSIDWRIEKPSSIDRNPNPIYNLSLLPLLLQLLGFFFVGSRYPLRFLGNRSIFLGLPLMIGICGDFHGEKLASSPSFFVCKRKRKEKMKNNYLDFYFFSTSIFCPYNLLFSVLGREKILIYTNSSVC